MPRRRTMKVGGRRRKRKTRRRRKPLEADCRQ